MFGWQRNADRANDSDALHPETGPAAAGPTITHPPSAEAQANDVQVRQFSAATQTTEGFASLIGDITGQIDLLNATIESVCDHEGEFAMIAGEVRTLAGQVRQAAAAVAATNGISGEVSAALEGIRDAIHRISALMAAASAAELMSRHSPQSRQRSSDRN